MRVAPSAEASPRAAWLARARRAFAFRLAASVSLAALTACAPPTLELQATAVAEGPRDSGEETAPEPPVAPGRAALPIERVASWDEVLRGLPKDAGGGADWVQAIRSGVIQPRRLHDMQLGAEPPFTLDTLARSIAPVGTPALDFDVKIIPTTNPFFQVVFPHSSHTLWLNCSSCHPGILDKRSGMTEIFTGDHCGACHGKVAFMPETACGRCHVNLRPPDAAALEKDLAAVQNRSLSSASQPAPWVENMYRGLCATCHGENGDGTGPFARFLDPKPRNFIDGTFKFRTTPSGSLPTDLDLFRTITTGLMGTGMPAWQSLSVEDRWALVQYIKGFSEVFEEEEPEDPVEIAEPPAATSELIAEGRQAYQEAKCWDCHGQGGAADGPSADKLKDDWDFPILPADLTRGVFKGGSGVVDVFRAISTGLDGTPMPSYGDVLSERERWAIASYVTVLGVDRKGYGVKGAIAFRRRPRGPKKDVEVPAASFPHWFHRVRFTCSACHPGIFRMKAGLAPITMDALRSGQFCGTCHNGRTAWPIAFETCRNCHKGMPATLPDLAAHAPAPVAGRAARLGSATQKAMSRASAVPRSD